MTVFDFHGDTPCRLAIAATHTNGVTGVGPHLAHQLAGVGFHQRSAETPLPGDQFRVPGHRLVDSRQCGFTGRRGVTGRRQFGKQQGQTVERKRGSRQVTAIDCPLDASGAHFADRGDGVHHPALQRMLRKVIPLQRLSQGFGRRQHARVLARAVAARGGGLKVASDPIEIDRIAYRWVTATAHVRLGGTRLCEQIARQANMPLFTAV
ncbi:hypothetical protein D3C80_1241390 [compost metagenome]